MNRKLKALGLALVAALALTAFSASIASAEFHSEVAHTIIDGAQPPEKNDIFTTNAGTVTCKTATYSGTQATATSSSQTVTPTYSECTAFGFVNATVDTNGCTYQFTTVLGTDGTGASGERLHILCPAGVVGITVTAFNCWVHVEPQTLKGITYHNKGVGAARDIEVTANVTGIKYIQTSKSFPGCTNGTFENGTYEGSATVTGTNTTVGAVGIWTSHSTG